MADTPESRADATPGTTRASVAGSRALEASSSVSNSAVPRASPNRVRRLSRSAATAVQKGGRAAGSGLVRAEAYVENVLFRALSRREQRKQNRRRLRGMASLRGFHDGRRALWMRWVRVAERRWALRYALARLRAQGLFAAIRRWKRRLAELALVRGAWLALVQPRLARGLRRWMAYGDESAWLRSLLSRGLLAMLHGALRRAFSAWHSRLLRWLRVRPMVEALHKSALRGSAKAAVRHWAAVVRREQVLARAAAALRHAARRSTFRLWWRTAAALRHAGLQQRRRHVRVQPSAQVVSRLRRRPLAMSWTVWHQRIGRRLAVLDVLGRAVVAMLHAWLWRGWSAWRQRVRRRAAFEVRVVQATRTLRTEGLLDAFAAWRRECIHAHLLQWSVIALRASEQQRVLRWWRLQVASPRAKRARRYARLTAAFSPEGRARLHGFHFWRSRSVGWRAARHAALHLAHDVTRRALLVWMVATQRGARSHAAAYRLLHQVSTAWMDSNEP